MTASRRRPVGQQDQRIRDLAGVEVGGGAACAPAASPRRKRGRGQRQAHHAFSFGARPISRVASSSTSAGLAPPATAR